MTFSQKGSDCGPFLPHVFSSVGWVGIEINTEERGKAMSDLMTTNQPCEACREGAAAARVTDISWWCWMFGCADCAREHHICGETRP